jgi:hypothetical protein
MGVPPKAGSARNPKVPALLRNLKFEIGNWQEKNAEKQSVLLRLIKFPISNF